MDRLAKVYFQGRFAGMLAKHAQGYSFRYDGEYLKTGPAIAYALPLSERPFDSEVLHPCFENLLAEGWLLGVQSHSERIDPTDKFGILLANGSDLAGAISIEVDDDL